MSTRAKVGFQVSSTQDGRAQVDGAAALMMGESIFSIPEERLSRIKHDGDVWRGLSVLLESAGLRIADIEQFWVSTCGEQTPPPDAPVWVRQDRRLSLGDLGVVPERVCWISSHHASHAFEALHSAQLVDRLRLPALVVVIDRVGNPGEHQSVYSFSDAGLDLLWRDAPSPAFASGIGAVYDYVTEHLGWSPNFDAGKTMALAGLATTAIDDSATLFEIVGDRLEMKTPADAKQRHAFFETTAPGAQRLSQRTGAGAKLAACVQRDTVRAVLAILDRLVARETSAIYFGGGAATNCVLIGAVARAFPNLIAQGSLCPGDTGQGVGNLSMAHFARTGRLPRAAGVDRLSRPDLRTSARVSRWPPRIVDRAAEAIDAGVIVMTCMAEHEPGPRALGFHSILADARNPSSKDRINSLLKRREAFRPFGALLGRTAAKKWFGTQAGEFMDVALPAPREFAATYPAVVHNDGTVRVQRADALTNGAFVQDLLEILAKNSIEAILNTSLNAAGQPIIYSVEDALSLARDSGTACCVITDQRGTYDFIELTDPP